MTVNYAGPYELEITYTSPAGEHKMRLNCDMVTDAGAGANFFSWNVVAADSSNPTLAVAVGELMTVLKPTLPSNIVFQAATLWYYPVQGQAREFRAEYELFEAGALTAVTANANQQTYTFRTQFGGRMRLSIMGAQVDQTSVTTYVGLSADQQAVVNYMLGTGAWIIGRDNGYPYSFLRLLFTQNEHLYRKLYRS